MIKENQNINNEIESVKQLIVADDYFQAEKLLKNILKNVPQEEYYLILGNIFFEVGKLEEAINSYKKSIEIKPNFCSPYNNLGVAYEKKNQRDEAINCYKKSIEIDPNNADAYCNLGVTLKNKGQIDAAIESYSKALNITPENASASCNMGIAYIAKRDIDNAVLCYQNALSFDPNYKSAYFNLAIAYLLKKDFKKGWPYYEWRFHNKKEPAPQVQNPKPKWNGSSLKDKIIYVYHEQGVGDTLQFIRFLPILKAIGAKKVLFKCQAGLEQLLKMEDFGAEIIDNSVSDELIEFDTYIPLLSLPNILNIRYENIPKTTKYLKADSLKAVEYKQRFFNNEKFKIGIFWQGSTEHKTDKERSLSLKTYYPLFDIPNVELYSLQKGFGVEQLQNLPEGLNIVNLGEQFNDFSDTAAAIENLDLVITVDSAVAHLAGAMGKPVWIILSSNLEWRWFLDEKDTIWYKSARLFRPEIGQSKDEVINKICKSLREELEQTVN